MCIIQQNQQVLSFVSEHDTRVPSGTSSVFAVLLHILKKIILPGVEHSLFGGYVTANMFNSHSNFLCIFMESGKPLSSFFCQLT